MTTPDIPPPGSNGNEVLDELVDMFKLNDDAMLVDSYSVIAGTVAGLGDDGTEAEMDALVLTLEGDGKEFQFVIPLDQWDGIANDAVRAAVDYVTTAPDEGAEMAPDQGRKD